MSAALVGRGVTASALDGKFEVELGLWTVHGEEVEVRVDNFHFGRRNDVGGSDRPFTAHLQMHAGRIYSIQFEAQLLDLQGHLDDIFANTRNFTELMQHIRDTDGGYSCAFQRREQYTAQ